jgi:hypothetical protein
MVKYLFAYDDLKTIFFAPYALFCITNLTSFIVKDGEGIFM